VVNGSEGVVVPMTVVGPCRGCPDQPPSQSKLPPRLLLVLLALLPILEDMCPLLLVIQVLAVSLVHGVTAAFLPLL
jgi:hypothetical protein